MPENVRFPTLKTEDCSRVGGVHLVHAGRVHLSQDDIINEMVDEKCNIRKSNDNLYLEICK